MNKALLALCDALALAAGVVEYRAAYPPTTPTAAEPQADDTRRRDPQARWQLQNWPELHDSSDDTL